MPLCIAVAHVVLSTSGRRLREMLLLVHFVDRDRWTYVPPTRTLAHNGQEHQLTPKQAGVLEVLTESAGEVVYRDTILDHVWSGEPVSDELLSRAIADLRKILGDDARRPRFIATVPRRGYRWMGAPLVSAPITEENRNPIQQHAGSRRYFRIAMASLTIAVSCIVTGIIAATSDDARQEPSQWDWNYSTPLTFDPGHEVTPDIRDGRIVYAASQENGSTDLFLKSAHDVSSSVRLTQTQASESAPVWSPDGLQIAFAATEAGKCRVVTLNLGTRSLEAVASCAGPLAGRTLAWSSIGIIHPARLSGSAGQAVALHATLPGQPSRQLTHPLPGETDASPAYAEDGTLVFFRSRPGDGGGKLMASDVDGERVLARVAGPIMALSNPDKTGQGLAVARNDERWGLWRYDLAGRMTLVRAMPVRGLSVDSDGTLVISQIALDYDIYSAPTTGGEAAPFIESTAHETTPAPNPASDQIAYVSRRGNDWSVFLADLEANTSRPLPGKVAQGARLAWRPDGERLSYIAIHEGAYRLIEVDRVGAIQSVHTFGDRIRHPVYRSNGDRMVACELAGAQRICDVSASGALAPVSGFDGAWPRPTNHGVYAYRTADRGLYRIGNSGTVTRLGTFSEPPGTHWDMDDSYLTVLQCPSPDETRLWRIELETGRRSLIAEYPGLGQVIQPVLDSVNGRLLFSKPGRSDSDLRIIPLMGDGLATEVSEPDQISSAFARVPSLGAL